MQLENLQFNNLNYFLQKIYAKLIDLEMILVQ